MHLLEEFEKKTLFKTFNEFNCWHHAFKWSTFKHFYIILNDYKSHFGLLSSVYSKILVF
jgi:hypothetical protein